LTTGIKDTGVKFAAGVNDTGGKLATGINNTSGKFATDRYQQHRRQILPPVSVVLLLPVANNEINIRLRIP
jgi:hypothetical protein